MEGLIIIQSSSRIEQYLYRLEYVPGHVTGIFLKDISPSLCITIKKKKIDSLY